MSWREPQPAMCCLVCHFCSACLLPGPSLRKCSSASAPGLSSPFLSWLFLSLCSFLLPSFLLFLIPREKKRAQRYSPWGVVGYDLRAGCDVEARVGERSCGAWGAGRLVCRRGSGSRRAVRVPRVDCERVGGRTEGRSLLRRRFEEQRKERPFVGVDEQKRGKLSPTTAAGDGSGGCGQLQLQCRSPKNNCWLLDEGR